VRNTRIRKINDLNKRIVLKDQTDLSVRKDKNVRKDRTDLSVLKAKQNAIRTLFVQTVSAEACPMSTDIISMDW
jgi:hypothetical protein